ncbi:MAG: outer membrane lipoprotein carrier protein LolA [Geobacteraceae bacterium]|nr:outer membrane lipoprotein carrier protein LolA [Geobacteraceae bacterium]
MFIPCIRNILYPLTAALVCIGILSTPIPASAETTADKAVLQKLLEAPFQPDADADIRIDDFRATFEQEAHIASLNRSKQGHGKVTVRFNAEKAASFRWDYLEPEEQHIISNGIKLWVYLPESNRVMISDVAQHLESGDDPLLFLRSLDNLERHFEISIPAPACAQGGDYLLTLTPKRDSAYVSTLTLHIPEEVVEKKLEDRFPLGGVTILDPNGNTTALKFGDVEVNTQPEPKTFSFSVPPGVEIVHPDSK